MTVPTLPSVDPGPSKEQPRPGSRAARMALPRSVEVLREVAGEYGVCIHPVSMRRTDLDTGRTEVIDLPCGATREDKCPPCAKRNRRLRQAQIREGWHRDDEPLPGPDPATEEQKALVVLRAHFEFERAEAARSCRWDQVADLDEAIREVEEAIAAEACVAGSPSPTIARTTRTGTTASGASGRPGGGRTHPTYPAARSTRAPSAVSTPRRTAPPTGRRCG